MTINPFILILLSIGLPALFAVNPSTGIFRDARAARALFGAGKLKRGRGT